MFYDLDLTVSSRKSGSGSEQQDFSRTLGPDMVGPDPYSRMKQDPKKSGPNPKL